MFMADSWFALRHPEYDRDFERNRPNRHPLKSSSYMNFRNNAKSAKSANQKLDRRKSNGALWLDKPQKRLGFELGCQEICEKKEEIYH